MSMLLWKTLALGGVIGVGSVVVVQAQRSLDTDSKMAEEQFPIFDGETGLETSFAEGDEKSPPKKLAADTSATPLLAAADPAATGPESANPFGSEPTAAEISRASAEMRGEGNPFESPPIGAADLNQSEPQPEPVAANDAGAASVTLDQPQQNKFTLLDGAGAAPPQSPEPAEANPFAVTPAAGEQKVDLAPSPLKKLGPEFGGPVLRSPPEEEPAATPAEADNPFAQFTRQPRALPEPAAQPAAAAEAEPGPPAFGSEPQAVEAAPLRTREPVTPASGKPLDLPVPALDSGMSDRPRRSGLPTLEQTEPAVASQQDAGLSAPAPPALPEVSFDQSPAPVQTAEAPPLRTRGAPNPGMFPGNSFPPAAPEASGSPAPAENAFPPADNPFPSANSPFPAGGSSIPGSTSPAAGGSSGSRSTPNTSTSIPSQPGKAALEEQALPPSAPNFGAPTPDEMPGRGPAFPGSSIPGGAGRSNANPPVTLPAAENPFPTEPLPTNPATAAPATPDLTGMATIDRSITTGPAQPQLTIVKQAPAEAVVGQDLEYSILVKNIGRSAAHNVVVEDLIPRGSRCNGTIPKAESQIEKKNLVWKLGTIPAGGEQLIRVKITPTDAGEIGSVATVSFSAEVAARTTIIEPKAVLNVVGPNEAVVGEPAQYRFNVTNNGPVDLKGVFVRTILPPQGLTHPGGSDLEYEMGDLPRGQSREVALTLTPSHQGNWQFQSMVTLNGRELMRSPSTIHVVGARLSVVRSGPTKRFVGRSATYNNSVTNNSGQTLTNVTVTETLPNGLDPAGPINNVQWDAGRRTLTWTIPQLAPGQSVDLPSTVMPKLAGSLQGQIIARDNSGNRAEIATALDVAGFSSLVVDGGHDGRPVAIGDQVSFRFTVKNRGTAPAEKVAAMFDLPDEVEFVNAQGPGNARFQRDGRLIIFDEISIVPPNGELTYDVVVKAKAVTKGDQRIRVSLNSTQLPVDRPLEKDQHLVIYGDDDDVPQPVQRASGTR